MSPTTIAIAMPGGPELFVIGVVFVLLFGKRVPAVARSLGSSLTEFKKGLRDGQAELDDVKTQLKDTADELKP